MSDETRSDETRSDETRSDETRSDETRSDETRSDETTPWGTGLTVSAFVAVVVAAAIVVLSLGMTRVHPLVSIGLNLVAVGGLAPTLWDWRNRPVRRWFVLGAAVGVAAGWTATLALMLG